MATVETVYHDFLSLSPEEQERLLELLHSSEPLSDEYWAAIMPELEERAAAFERGENPTISAEEALTRIRSIIDARRD